MGNKSYYEILGISPDAGSDEIKTAYRRLAFEYHPDRNGDDDTAADKMKALNEAYAVLSDNDKRQKYNTFFHQYGDDAQTHFRQNYSEQDIFKGSDIHQMFEEMARAFGLRGFDEIFSDLDGKGYRSFDFSNQGLSGKGDIFGAAFGSRSAGNAPKGIAGKMVHKLLNKVAGAYFPRQGDDLHDAIVVTSAFALQGGPYAYRHRTRDKKLVVHVPTGVKDGQQVRLVGMGQNGTLGAEPGDLLLRVKIRDPLLTKLKKIVGIDR